MNPYNNTVTVIADDGTETSAKVMLRPILVTAGQEPDSLTGRLTASRELIAKLRRQNHESATNVRLPDNTVTRLTITNDDGHVVAADPAAFGLKP